jgi:hypothetical protein
MKRLKSEWANSFGEARQLALWETFHNIPDAVFTAATTRLILNGNAYPPRLKEFEAEIELARGRWKEREYDKISGTGFSKDLDTAATPERLALVREMVQGIVHKQPVEHSAVPEHRAEELKRQLKLVGRDLAAGKEKDD